MNQQIEYCERCGKELKEESITWLELSNTDGLYYKTEIPSNHVSQGVFAFGKRCANQMVKEQNSKIAECKDV